MIKFYILIVGHFLDQSHKLISIFSFDFALQTAHSSTEVNCNITNFTFRDRFTRIFTNDISNENRNFKSIRIIFSLLPKEDFSYLTYTSNDLITFLNEYQIQIIILHHNKNKIPFFRYFKRICCINAYISFPNSSSIFS